MARIAMVIDLNKCVGCLACTLACIRENIARQTGSSVEMPKPPFEYARTRPVMLPRAAEVKVADLPPRTEFFVQCMHCERPPCVAVCPTKACHVTEEGVVIIDGKRCIGCRACMVACPYGVRTMYLGELKGEPPNPYALKPFYPDKCTFCYHRKGEGSWVPACVEACAFGARVFGDLDDPNSEVSRIIRGGAAVAIGEYMGTKPKLFFILPRKVRG